MTPAPRWHWPLRVRCLDDPLSETLASALRNTYPCGMGLADVLRPGDEDRPAELLILPWSLAESVTHVTAASLQAPVACVAVLGGGQDLPWPELRARKDEILAVTGAAGLYITDLDQAQAASWFTELGFNLDHNYQLDVAITSAWYGGFGPLKGLLGTAPTSAGVLFAAPGLLEVSQLANQVTAIASGFAALPGNPILAVPPGLHIPPGRLPAQELAKQILEQASHFGYEHESSEATAVAGAGRALDEAEAVRQPHPSTRASPTPSRRSRSSQPTPSVPTIPGHGTSGRRTGPTGCWTARLRRWSANRSRWRSACPRSRPAASPEHGCSCRRCRHRTRSRTKSWCGSRPRASRSDRA